MLGDTPQDEERNSRTESLLAWAPKPFLSQSSPLSLVSSLIGNGDRGVAVRLWEVV